MMNTKGLMVVEGADDKHVVWAILKRHQFLPIFEISDENGYENLCIRLPIRLKPGTDYGRLAIVIDADMDLAARWHSIGNLLRKAGYVDVPDLPDPSGTVLEREHLPRVGIWIMPDNRLQGMLEDYLAYLIPDGDRLLPHAITSLNGIPEAHRQFRPVHRTKALIHTWLAWQEDPGSPLGLSITKKYFEADGQPVTDFIAWLTRVFGSVL